MSKLVEWRTRFSVWLGEQSRGLRRRAVSVLAAVGDPEPAGGVVPQHFAIDDGVDYNLPLVVPDWLTGAKRDEYVTKAIQEAGAQYHFQFDRPYLYNENPSQFPTASPLLEWDQGTRREVVSRTHLAYERNPLAKRAVRLTTSFVVGQGLTVTYANPDVERVLEEFRAEPENDVEGYEKTLCSDLQVDGELFIRFYKNATGQMVIVPLPSTDFLWIVSAMGFKRRFETFHRQGVQSTGFPGSIEYVIEDIPADEILFVAINRHSYEVRGRPELFAILPWLKAYKDWLEGRARQNHWRGSLLYQVTLDGALPSVVSAKRAQYKQPPSPGSLVIHNDKEHWDAIESKVGAADVSEDGRQMKLMVAVGEGLPEYMLSDGQNANLASSSSQQLPALRTFADFQDVMVSQIWKPVYRKVIANAIAAGVLTEMVQKHDTNGDPMTDDDGQPIMIKAEKAFDVSAPELEADDPLNLAQALEIASSHGWVSDETASGEMGYDFTAEQKKIDRGMQKNLERQAQGLAAGGFSPARTPAAPFPTEEPLPPGPAGGPGKPDPATGAPRRQKPSTAALANDGRAPVAQPAGAAAQESRRPASRVAVVASAGPAIEAFELTEVDRQERPALAAVHAVLVSLGSAANAPEKLAIDDELVRWAGRGADLASREIAGRDEQGRVASVRRVFETGEAIYRVKRDSQGKLTTLERAE